MNKNLSMIVSETNALTEILIKNGGELTEELETMLGCIELELAVKIDGYNAIMDRVEMEAQYWKEKSEQFIKISRACKKVKSRLNENIKKAMLEMDITEALGIDWRFKLSKTKPKLIIDDEDIPAKYCKEVVSFVADKEMIRQDLVEGATVTGARLEQGFSLRTYCNKKEKL